MKRLFSRLDAAPQRTPERLKPFLRPFWNGYRAARRATLSQLPERPRTTPEGITIKTDMSQYVDRELVMGNYETETIAFLRELVDDRQLRFADIGANIGYFSLLVATYSAAESQVDAFEPLPDAQERFRENVRLNQLDNVTLHTVALSDSAGEDEPTVPESRGETSLSVTEGSSSPGERMQISKTRLNDFYAGPKTTPDLLKIDVEGAEAGVLRGGSELIATERPQILLEVHPERLERFGDSIEIVADLLRDFGYEDIHHVESDRTVPLAELGTHNGDHYYVE